MVRRTLARVAAIVASLACTANYAFGRHIRISPPSSHPAVSHEKAPYIDQDSNRAAIEAFVKWYKTSGYEVRLNKAEYKTDGNVLRFRFSATKRTPVKNGAKIHTIKVEVTGWDGKSGSNEFKDFYTTVKR